MKDRLELQFKLLTAITKSPHYINGDYSKLAKLLTKETSKKMKVSRVGVWFFNDDLTELQCISQYQCDKYQPLVNLSTSDFPKYFNAIKNKNTLKANNVYETKETAELVEGYFKPNNICSLLDSAIFDGDKIVGVICLECRTEFRTWQQDEVNISRVLGQIMGATYSYQKRREAEKELLEVQNDLTETNITLKNILERFEEEKKEYNENIALNIEKNIKPIIELLKNDKGTDQNLVSRLEAGISNLSSSFYKKLVKVNYNLTPTEIKVCQMIKSGYQGKEIADFLNLSFSTIETHKKNIRKKLELTGKSINLRVYLNEIENL